MKKLKLGVRQKVLLLLMAVLLTALTVSGWFALQEEKAGVLSEINRRGSDISRFVAKSLVYSVVGYDYHTIDLLLDEITLSEDISYAKVVNSKGNIMSESGDPESGGNEPVVMFEEKILLEDEPVGTLTLGLSTNSTFGRLEHQKYSLIKREAFIILLIALGEFLALSYIIIRPVSVISKSLEDQILEDDQIVGKIPITSNDEFGDLAERFNLLSENLNTANRELKSRVDFADDQLVKNNLILQQQSEELQKMNQEFHRLSITDDLTNLYNRRYFEDALASEIEMTRRHGDTNSLVIIDIDHFKSINDTYGHDIGDKVLKEVAVIMEKRLRKSDLICRIGGEEFVSLCKRADKDAVKNLAEKLRQSIENYTFCIDDIEVKITASFGIATITKENVDTDAENYFKYADIALYKSKESGRNRISHYDDLIA